MQAWVREELGAVRLGDRRLERRLRTVVEQLSRHPERSVHDACATWAQRQGAYRLFGNAAVAPEQILAPHTVRTWQRAAEEAVLLVVQDTTSLDYSSHPKTEGLGPLAQAGLRGAYVHSALALTEEGEPLGLVHQARWVRDPDAVGTRHTRRERPWPDKESYKWQRTVEALLAHCLPGQRVVVIGDRESDVYGLFASPRPDGVELLVRSAQNRKLPQEEGFLHEAVRRGPAAGTLLVSVGRARDREPRTAVCEVRYRAVKLQPPRHADAGVPREPVRVWAVALDEPTPPTGEPPLHWILLATWPLETVAAAVQGAHYYSRRWLVERYHFVLKSGCRLEAAQLRTWERLERLVAVGTLLAWRLLALTYQARLRPEAACALVLGEREWQVLYAHHHGHLLAAGEPPPSLGEALRWVADLGGYGGRRSDGPPGVKVLWRGLARLEEMVRGFTLATSLLSPAARCV